MLHTGTAIGVSFISWYFNCTEIHYVEVVQSELVVVIYMPNCWKVLIMMLLNPHIRSVHIWYMLWKMHSAVLGYEELCIKKLLYQFMSLFCISPLTVVNVDSCVCYSNKIQMFVLCVHILLMYAACMFPTNVWIRLPLYDYHAFQHTIFVHPTRHELDLYLCHCHHESWLIISLFISTISTA
jgi:hypothetical protein